MSVTKFGNADDSSNRTRIFSHGHAQLTPGAQGLLDFTGSVSLTNQLSESLMRGGGITELPSVNDRKKAQKMSTYNKCLRDFSFACFLYNMLRNSYDRLTGERGRAESASSKCASGVKSLCVFETHLT